MVFWPCQIEWLWTFISWSTSVTTSLRGKLSRRSYLFSNRSLCCCGWACNGIRRNASWPYRTVRVHTEGRNYLWRDCNKKMVGLGAIFSFCFDPFVGYVVFCCFFFSFFFSIREKNPFWLSLIFWRWWEKLIQTGEQHDCAYHFLTVLIQKLEHNFHYFCREFNDFYSFRHLNFCYKSEPKLEGLCSTYSSISLTERNEANKHARILN